MPRARGLSRRFAAGRTAELRVRRGPLRWRHVLSRELVEEIGERGGVFDHWEVAARNLNRVDAQELARHEPLPGWLEDLILGRVDEHGWDIGVPGKRKLVRWRDCR